MSVSLKKKKKNIPTHTLLNLSEIKAGANVILECQKVTSCGSLFAFESREHNGACFGGGGGATVRCCTTGEKSDELTNEECVKIFAAHTLTQRRPSIEQNQNEIHWAYILTTPPTPLSARRNTLEFYPAEWELYTLLAFARLCERVLHTRGLSLSLAFFSLATSKRRVLYTLCVRTHLYMYPKKARKYTTLCLNCIKPNDCVYIEVYIHNKAAGAIDLPTRATLIPRTKGKCIYIYIAAWNIQHLHTAPLEYPLFG